MVSTRTNQFGVNVQLFPADDVYPYVSLSVGHDAKVVLQAVLGKTMRERLASYSTTAEEDQVRPLTVYLFVLY